MPYSDPYFGPTFNPDRYRAPKLKRSVVTLDLKLILTHLTVIPTHPTPTMPVPPLPHMHLYMTFVPGNTCMSTEAALTAEGNRRPHVAMYHLLCGADWLLGVRFCQLDLQWSQLVQHC